MRASRILSVGGAAIAAAFLLSCSPSPKKVCDKLERIAPSTLQPPFSATACIAREQSLRARRGSSWYGGRGRCILRSTSYEPALRCRGRYEKRKGRVEHRSTIRIGGRKDKKKSKKKRRKR